MEFTGYYPGVIGKIIELHAVYYNDNWGLDVTFEIQVGEELSSFISEFRQGRDGLWVSRVDNSFAGCIVIDGKLAGTEGARLRWFIVAPEFQGAGVGRALLCHAIGFCREAGYKKLLLWTFKGLDAARSLYKSEGFRLCREHNVYQWGRNITEQKFELNL